MNIEIIFNLASAPFGFAAMYYGYLGYRQTKGGLRAYLYFFLAMTGLGATMLFDILQILGYSPFEYLVEAGLFVVAVFFMLAFKDMYKFLTSI